jgi:UDP-3-O-[3-hydroxymyristoyl] glucosamine N-acyltransferase
MALIVQELAAKINATVIGNQTLLIDTVGEFEDCENPNTLVVCIDKKRLKQYRQTGKQPKIIVLNEDVPEFTGTKLITSQGKTVLIDILNMVYPEDFVGFIADSAIISPAVSLGTNVKIYPGVYLGEGVEVGDNTIIYPNVVVYHACKIGRNCIVHANTVIGSDGYGFITNTDGTHTKIPQKGIVIVEDDVEIGACCTIDRATLKATVIGQGSKLDNKVHIAHNAKIGKNCLLAGASNVSGSAVLEDNVILAGGAGVADGVTVGKGSVITAMTATITDVPAATQWYGTPVGDEIMIAMKRRALYNKLPELFERVKTLEKNTGHAG